MKQHAFPLSILFLTLMTSLLMAAEWWEKKSASEWTEKDARRMLDQSPWAKVHTVSIVNPTTTGKSSFENIGTGDLEREKRVRFHLRFLTAKPIRLALARQMLLAKNKPVQPVDLDGFVNRGNDREIILLMTLSGVPEGSSALRGYWSTLLSLSTPLLITETYLATGSGKRVYITRYLPPGKDGLGARFCFPRTLEDGTPLITAGDRVVHFETYIDLVETGTSSATPGQNENVRRERVWMKFDLDKMIFDGKLEI